MGEWDGDIPGYTISEQWQRDVQAGVHEALDLMAPAVVILHRPHHKDFAQACLKATAARFGVDRPKVSFKIDNLKRLGLVEEL